MALKNWMKSPGAHSYMTTPDQYGETTGYKAGRALGAALGRIFGRRKSGGVLTASPEENVGVEYEYGAPVSVETSPRDFGESIETNPDYMDELGETIETQSVGQNWAQGFEESVDNTVQGFKDLPSNLADSIIKGEEVFEELPDKVIEKSKVAAQAILDLPNDIAETIHTSANEPGGTLHDFSGNLSESLGNAGQAFKTLPGKLQDRMGRVADAVVQLPGQIGETFSEGVASTIGTEEGEGMLPDSIPFIGSKEKMQWWINRVSPANHLTTMGHSLYNSLFGSEDEIDVYTPPPPDTADDSQGQQ